MSDPQKNTDPAAMRSALWARLEGARGRDYWRSLDDLAATPEFQDLLEREFPRQAVGWSEDEDPVEGRRNFLKLMGASLALAGMTACTRQPTEHIMPYVRQPEDLIPGRPLFFATATTLNGVANGMLVESHEGRPTKMEGNPGHPATLGACDSYSQAAILQLYDPDRAQALSYNGEISSWSEYAGALRDALAQQKGKNGAGIRILTETVTSPSMAEQLRTIQKLYPASKWHQWEPAGPHSARAAAMQAFGQPVNTYYDFSNANVVVSLDSDFLASGPASLRYARQFSRRRRVEQPSDTMSRLYVVEPMPTPTGTKADHRLALRASDIEEFAWSLAVSLGIAQGPKTGDNHDIYKWLGPIARDLESNKGASIVIAGEQQPPIVHALAAIMNEKLGNVGKTVFHTDPVEASSVDQLASLLDLVKDLDAGAVELLIIIGGNPAFNAPVELGMARPPEESQAADSPGPVLRRNQPGMPVADAGDAYAGNLGRRARLRRHGHHSAASDSAALRRPLGDAVAAIADRAAREDSLRDRQELLEQPAHGDRLRGLVAACRARWHGARYRAAGEERQRPRRGSQFARRGQKLGGKLEVIFRPDPTIYDGRFANNGWLQELPKPITKLTWDNAAFLSPATAHRLGVQTGDLLKLTYDGRSLNAPVFIQPGHVNGATTLHLGYGRTHAGRAGNGMGFNPYGLRTAKALWQDVGLDAVKTGGKLRIRFHAELSPAGDSRPPPHHSSRRPGGVPKESRSAARRRGESAARTHALSGMEVRGLRLGYGDRPELVHRMRRLRGRLPGGEQYRGGGQRPGAPRARHALGARGFLLSGRGERPRDLQPAGAVHAVRECALRTGLSRCRPPRTAPKA